MNEKQAQQLVNRRSLALGVGSAGVLAGTQANAFDASTVLSGSDATSNSDSTAVFVIGVVVILFALAMVRKGLGK